MIYETTHTEPEVDAMTHEHRQALTGERTVALRLTNDQVKQILGVLREAQSEADGNKVEKLQELQSAVVTATYATSEQVRCKSCGKLFSAITGRRPARYCSASCKQKAYRNRLAEREHA